ncbi:alpha-ketoacid dehydrogenase subunit beta [Paeniglutamicibacter gangotriensis]|uniref:alpha-ketoacid dehydrogenase subunit beta n=1 Tax=Paeniglutamicibacter gangotriensis TaxID=254787 RepID=UPI0037C58EF7
MTSLTFSQALNTSLRDSMERDDKVLLMGEDIGKLGGVFRITDGLQKDFGQHRVIDTPLAESGIVGAAIGLAFRGYRPVVEIQFDGFVYPAFDQIVSQLAKMHFRSRGNVKLPVTIRIPFGGGIGSPEHHSESPEAYFAHTAGLRVVSPSNPQDAYTMLAQAIADDDPVIFMEPKRRYHTRGEVDTELVPDPGSLYQAKVLRQGRDLTLIAYGPLVKTALDAAEAAVDEGVDIEVIDLRSIEPVDFETLTASVRKTGRVLITHEASISGGIGAELAASLTERCFDHLDHAPVRVTGFDIPYPPAKLESHHLPDLDRILDGVDRAMRRNPPLVGEDG